METINRWSDGSYWNSTEGKTVKVDLTTLRILQTVDLFKGEKSTFQFDGATDCYDDGRGSLWYGTMGLGLYRFEPESKRVANFRYSRQATDFANRLDVCRNVTGGGGGTLFLASFVDGLMKFDISAAKFTEVMSANIYHVMRDNRGNIWAAGENDGLFVLDSSGRRIDHLLHESMRAGGDHGECRCAGRMG